MINDVVLEGIVVRDPWNFMDEPFLRLVIYRDSDLPAKKLDLERDAGDYINVRVNGGANGLIHNDRNVVEVVSRRIIFLGTAAQNENKARTTDKLKPVKRIEAGNDSNEEVSTSGEVETTAI